MKRVSLLSTLCFLLFLVNACQRSFERPVTQAVKGQWEWTYSAGGLGGYSLAPANNTRITLDLNKDFTYIFYLNNMPQFNGNYSLRTADNKPMLQFDRSIAVNQLSLEPEQQILVWDSSELQLADYGVNDGFTHYFKKIK